MSNQKFELEKAVQAINYIIKCLGVKHMNKLDLLKLIYLSDRYHLRKYGRLITNDDYWAMTYGPVASSVKDVVEIGDFLSQNEKNYVQKYLDRCYTHQVKSVEEVDFDVLSETDIESLNAAITQYKTHSDMVAFTHLFPEWKIHEVSINSVKGRVKMDMVHCFDDAPDNAEYCQVSRELLDLNKEHFLDSTVLDCLW